MNMRGGLISLIVVGTCVSAVGCTETDSQEAHENSVISQGIVGGAPESGYDAVGALMLDGEQFCTGTLVRPDIVVTAAHCLIEDQGSPESVSFFIGANANRVSSGRSYNAATFYIHPEYDNNALINDIAVIRLAQPVTGVAPIPYMTGSMSQGFIGRETLFVGYGITSTSGEGAGEKRSVRIPIIEIEPTVFIYSRNGANTCSGDSGGPALLDIDGTTTLVGVTSYGDEDCIEYGANTRVDAFKDYIAQAIDGSASTDPVDGGGDGGDGDFCAEEGWYNDGVCDDDCPQPDPDCNGNDGGGNGDFCAEEGWYDDGVCDDDCPQPDPDCGGNDGGGNDNSDDFCAEEGWYDDGVCDDDCPQPDPDCNGNDGGGNDDFCAEEGWYNDGECDDDCPQPDPDCGGNDDGNSGDDGNEGDFCTEEGLYGDGVCDDCPRTDSDCEGTDDVNTEDNTQPEDDESLNNNDGVVGFNGNGGCSTVGTNTHGNFAPLLLMILVGLGFVARRRSA